MSRLRTFRFLVTLLASSFCLACDESGAEAELPVEFLGARPLTVMQSACAGDPYTMMVAPSLQLAADGGTLVGVYKAAQFRCGDQKLCGYALEVDLTTRVLVQPCDLHPTSVARCDCLYDVTFWLDQPSGRRSVELWSRRDLYGASGTVNAQKIDAKPVP